MNLWPFSRRDDGLSIPEFPPMKPVDPVEQSCIDRLRRENAELRAQIRSMASSLGNRRKTIKRLEAELARARGA
jgi:hypothetical protein